MNDLCKCRINLIEIFYVKERKFRFLDFVEQIRKIRPKKIFCQKQKYLGKNQDIIFVKNSLKKKYIPKKLSKQKLRF